jgi:hypothetical protein
MLGVYKKKNYIKKKTTGINKGWIFKIYASKLSYLSLEKTWDIFYFSFVHDMFSIDHQFLE